MWKRCDGQLSLAEISGVLALEPETVEQAVHELRESGLLVEGLDVERVFSRRDAAIRLGKVAGAASLVLFDADRTGFSGGIGLRGKPGHTDSAPMSGANQRNRS